LKIEKSNYSHSISTSEKPMSQDAVSTIAVINITI